MPLDVHMMVLEPERFLPELAEAGADIITVHAEACRDIVGAVRQIKSAGVRAGVAISPGTPASALDAVLGDVDLALVMTVNPGLGGQPFIWDAVEKIRQVRAALDGAGLPAEIEVDGWHKCGHGEGGRRGRRASARGGHRRLQRRHHRR